MMLKSYNDNKFDTIVDRRDHVTESKLFHFHRIFKNKGGDSGKPPEPHLDRPLI